MKTVTIKQVSNGYVIECDGETHIAAVIENASYVTYRKPSVTEVLESIFNPAEPVQLKEAA